VAEALGVALGARERRALAGRPTDNLAAYEAYLQAENLRRTANTDPASLRRAGELYERAVALDSAFGLAWAGLAEVDQETYSFMDPSPARLARARAEAERAVRVAPDRARPHDVLGEYYLEAYGPDSALREFRLAQQIAPSDAQPATWIALALSIKGDWHEALRQAERAAALDPRSGEAHRHLAWSYWMRRNYRGALHEADRAIEVAPEVPVLYLVKADIQFRLGGDVAAARETVREAVAKFGLVRVTGSGVSDVPVEVLDPTELAPLGRLGLEAFGGDSVTYYSRTARVSARLGRAAEERTYLDSARRVLEARVHALPQEWSPMVRLAELYARLGRDAEARRELTRAAPLARAWGVGDPVTDVTSTEALVNMFGGRPDAAVADLKRLLGVPSLISVPALRVDPLWEPLRSNPRFQRLLAAKP
jgi:tetratricopeptide (TPR) repeat protein